MVSLSLNISSKTGTVTFAGNDGFDPKMPVKTGSYETFEEGKIRFREVGEKEEVIKSALKFLERNATVLNEDEDYKEIAKTFFD
jgi:hypothetical protein